MSARKDMSGRPPAGASTWTSFRQQTWLLAVSGRWLLWIVGLGTLRLLSLAGPTTSPPLIAGLLQVIGATVWAILVWRGESSRRRSYHWSLPVSRPAHDLARVAAGGVFLLAACALWGGIEAVVASRAGATDPSLPPLAEMWARSVVAPVIAYLLATPLILWGDSRLTRWLLGAVMILGLVAVLLDANGIDLLLRGYGTVLGPEGWGLTAAMVPGVALELGHGSSWGAAALWLGVGGALTILAARYRSSDLRRFFRRARADATGT